MHVYPQDRFTHWDKNTEVRLCGPASSRKPICRLEPRRRGRDHRSNPMSFRLRAREALMLVMWRAWDRIWSSRRTSPAAKICKSTVQLRTRSASKTKGLPSDGRRQLNLKHFRAKAAFTVRL